MNQFTEYDIDVVNSVTVMEQNGTVTFSFHLMQNVSCIHLSIFVGDLVIVDGNVAVDMSSVKRERFPVRLCFDECKPLSKSHY